MKNVVETNFSFFCSNSSQKISLDKGIYKFDVYGASGGGNIGGKGGYSSGILILKKEEFFYVYVGCRGSDDRIGGFNGGGNGGKGGFFSNQKLDNGGGGGGSSDIRIDPNDLDSRIIVAGGGGGSCGLSWSGGGDGGGLIGGASPQAYSSITPLLGGNQTGGYQKLYGQDAIDSQHTGNHSGEGDGGGGGGWYGGFANQKLEAPNNNGGSGGSSYISGYEGCPKSPTKFVFTNMKMEQGTNIGDGFISITKLIQVYCRSNNPNILKVYVFVYVFCVS